MTIKQQGGVFGRNPTFNDLTAETADFSSSVLGSASATALTINSTADRNVILRDNDAFSGTDNQIKLAIAPSVTSGQSAGVAFGTFSNPQYWKQGIFWKRSSTYGIGDLSFAVRSTADTTTVTEADKKLTIGRYGDVTVHSGNLVIGTSGQGIDFSATSGTGTSELFDDYEEGTWTPTIAGQSSGGTGTYTSQSGGYRKVGGMVQAWFQVGISAHTGAGVIDIEGFPFASANDGLAQVGTAATLDMTYTAAGTPVLRMTANSAKANLYTIASGSSWTAQSLATDTVFTIYGSLCYKTT